MNFLLLILAAFVSVIVATTSKTNLRSQAAPKVLTPLTTYPFSCPGLSKISQINGNTGAILDRLNLRCNDSKLSQSPDFGVGIGYVTSPKPARVKLPAGAKGWDTVSVGYGLYDSRSTGSLHWVVASIRVCAKGTCFDLFINGLTICSSDASQPSNVKCPTINTWDYTNTGKVWNGAVANYYPDKGIGYIQDLTPTFA
jgi:hypothetical protein